STNYYFVAQSDLFFGSPSAPRAFRQGLAAADPVGIVPRERLVLPIPSFFGSPSAPRAFRQGLAGSLCSPESSIEPKHVSIGRV
ncbi:hypothetical protein PRIPAC_89081, partial [Pristionchus pacificus]|uniref:Uncharacterized protein n=1 Tax=Pristionchus pacificus TaxID=54126 RepID=A0A2A6CXM9_PRIPA